MMRIAVVGGGISGIGAAYELAKAGVKVSLYEKEDNLGGHTNNTVTIDGVQLDLAFMLFNRVSFPNLMELLENLGVEMEDSSMSFSVSLDEGLGCEWGTQNGLSSMFAQKRNIVNPHFWRMLHESNKFNDDVNRYSSYLVENKAEMNGSETLKSFIKSKGYSKLCEEAYIVPICGSLWACGSQHVMDLPAFSVLSCYRNRMFQMYGGPQWFTLKGGSPSFLNKVTNELLTRGCKIVLADGSEDFYDGCILAIHAPHILQTLGDQVTPDETTTLAAFHYFYNDVFLHQDESIMPQKRATWSACNFIGSSNNRTSLTYWLNVMQQKIDKGDGAYFVTLNPVDVPKHVLLKWSVGQPIPSFAASKASLAMNNIQGKRRIWFCNTYHAGYGFHEDGLKAGMVAAHQLLGTNQIVLQNPKQMITSLTETVARIVTIRFLKQYISIGCLIILEEGGEVLTFQGSSKKHGVKVEIRVHNPQFYWKVCMEADLGLADAYINGDFTLVDKNEGLLNLFKLFIANSDSSNSDALGHPNTKRGWWTPKLFTAVIASKKYFYYHLCRKNTLAQARMNISRHYDVSNDIFSIFLDETMQYSCAMFKSKNEDLRDAQLRKMEVIIEKAKIKENDEVLEIGFGWGNLGIDIVRRTGCRYTGITISDEQLRYAEKKVKDSGLQDRISFILCDYRQLPREHKYDRIISIEMIEHVGHEYMEEFFRCCDNLLAENGLLVLQFISVRDYSYDECRQSPGFMKEYIFPGACLPSLSKVTSAMATSTTLCVEHVENIGSHYYRTLRSWRKNFLEQQRKIMSLGFDEKFIKTWEYYFDYCAAGFDLRYLGNYQVVFFRPTSNPCQDAPDISM